ncbi:Beta-1,3-glucan-binding protein [Grifola frondosa]|uniref:Beta-1,3-glucan-binding protein n=1 Tax=Grifola frondosa TaxID=5627 RepID=A0A1C7M933_GRIFR|nr:Beta-1,3-glucan-binding protein [Grifola frondosa]
MVSSPPSTSSSSSSTHPGPGRIPSRSENDESLHPPKSVFFIDPRWASSEAGDESPHDPFSTPDASVPGTPIPFSTPASVSALRSSPEIREVPSNMRSRASSSSQVRNSFMPPPAIRRTTLRESTLPNSALPNVPRLAKRARSTMLTGETEKPWVTEKDTYAKLSYWLTYGVALIGIAAAVIRCYFAWKQTLLIGNICPVMTDEFDTFDTENTWFQESSLGGFGNGEFEMTTNSPNNSFVKDGLLYIVPTLTSDVIGYENVLNGYTYNITGCTDKNATACGAVSNSTAGTVINPVMSARISTRNSYSLQYGKVEIRAKLPRETGSGQPCEIDIMESRGNGPEYGAQGDNYVRGSLNWGLFPWLNGVSKTFGWWTNRRKTFADDFHIYSLEWTPQFIRIYVDSRLTYMLTLRFNEPFFKRGDFPAIVANGSNYIPTTDPWAQGTPNVAPFDKPFYLIMNVAVGGTNGWFPDGVGDKPWLDGSLTAMTDFAHLQSEWYSSWPQNIEDRALVVDYVKMWKLC